MKYAVAASLTLLLATAFPASAQPRETITFWEFPGYAIRIFRENAQYKINLYNRQTRTLELNAALITREATADGANYRYRGQFDVNIFVAYDQQTPNTGEISGNCQDFTCSALSGRLQQAFPKQASGWNNSCTNDLALNVFSRDESQRVNFICWEPPTANASRNGSLLGILPYPDEETLFPVAIASNEPTIQAALDSNPQIVQQMGFDCAVQGGNVNILAGEDAVTLQCFFQAGVQVLDLDGDGISDGENSMGAGVDFTRIIPLR